MRRVYETTYCLHGFVPIPDCKLKDSEDSINESCALWKGLGAGASGFGV